MQAPVEPAELVEAVQLADWPRALELIRANWLTLLVEHQATVRWLYQQLPAEVIESDALVRTGKLFLGVVSATGAEADTEVPEDPAELARLGRAADAGETIARITAQAITSHWAGATKAACVLAGKAAAIAREALSAQREQVSELIPTCALMWGITRQLAGDYDGALVDLEQAYVGHLNLGSETLARYSAAYAAMSLALIGDTVAASKWVEREEAIPKPANWQGTAAQLSDSVARILVSVDRLTPEAAAESLEDGTRLFDKQDFWPFAAFALAQHALLYGRPSDVEQRLMETTRARSSELGDGIAGPLLTAASVNLLMAAGHGDQAKRKLVEADLTYAPLALAAARLDFLSGHPESARTAVARELGRRPNPAVRMELLLLRATVQLRLGEEEAAASALAGALELMTRHQLFRPLATVPRYVLAAFTDRVLGVSEVIEMLDRLDVREIFPKSLSLVELTPRERVVLQELATGDEAVQTARKLFVSVATIKSQRHSLYQKLGVHSREEALTQAYERGLL